MNPTLAILLTVAGGYLLGTVLGGAIMARLRGVDLRASGSGNVGATNALRAGGARMAVPVLVIDIGKGIVAVTLLPWLLGAYAEPRQLAYIASVAAALGHCYPIWTGFTGGKGVATLAGVFAVLLPAATLAILIVFLLCVLTTGYVGAASILGALTAVAWVLLAPLGPLPPGTAAFVMAMAALVVFKHRDNLQRLAEGTEVRMDKLAVLRRWWLGSRR